MNLLNSKTTRGLLSFLAITLLLTYTHHLGEHEVEVIKWLALSYFGVRTASNIAENFGKKDVS